uniref:Uncharacterized protein n=1 Tax=Timema cristinae TaxID=61476 RepID=A0A7R9GRP2_TIMCR|nr:unnamed protein product [Timema cristinae]
MFLHTSPVAWGFTGNVRDLIRSKGSSGAAMSCGVTWVAASLKRGFYKLGVVVGRHPGYFLIVPVLLSLACVTGYQRIKYEIDPEYLFSPVWGEGKAERAVVEEFFKPNYTSRFNVGRITRPGEKEAPDHRKRGSRVK